MGDVHASFKVGADMRLWTRRKVVSMKDLCGLGEGANAWVKNSAASVSFSGLRTILLMLSLVTWSWKECPST